MGTAIVQGRAFDDRDNGQSAGVAIVNEVFAVQSGAGDLLGKRLRAFVALNCAGCIPGTPVELEVVGIAANVHEQGLDHAPAAQIYLPFAQAPEASFNIVLSTDRNPGVLSEPLRSIVFKLSHHTPTYNVATLSQRLSESLARRRLIMFLLSAFAAVALTLAAIGVYGVISYTIVQRTQEIGIRMALGATRGSVLRLVLQRQAQVIVLGSSAGLLLSLASSEVMSSLLYGTQPHVLASFALAWITLTIAAMLATAAPVLKAARIDPSAAMRYE